MADTEGILVVRLKPPLRQNYSIFMRNFQENQYKTSNYQVQFSNRTPFVNLHPFARNVGSAHASTIYFILLTWASPNGTHMEPGCTLHMGAHMGHIKIASWARAGLFSFFQHHCPNPYTVHLRYCILLRTIAAWNTFKTEITQ